MTEKLTVTLPVIHINGTSAKTLKDEIKVAVAAIDAAKKSIEAMTVHARDHYVKADKQSYEFARNEHIERLKRLQTTRDELTILWNGISDQERKA